MCDWERPAGLALGLTFNPSWAVDADASWEAFDKANACERLADIIRIAVEATKDAALPNGLQGLAALGHVWIEAAINAWIEHGRLEIGRASCRERVWPYVEIWVVDVSFKKKKTE